MELLKSLLVCSLLIFLAPSLQAADDEEAGSSSDAVMYVELKPAFVTNYQSRKLGYLKADVTLKVKGQNTADAVERHRPYIRHNLVMLFSRQDNEGLATPEGKMQLKQDALQEILMVLKTEGEPAQVEDILFTSFILD